MINETLNGTVNNLTFENVTAITTSPIFITMIIAVWLIPIIVYLIVGATVKAKSPSGKRMMEFPNFWYGFIIWFFLQAALFLILIVFPVWLKLVG